ncbi:MAG: MmcQ/YjbR family DNA-binding protein [Rhizomicrobium sp.]|nr:MmcQ/YjbR family DNA-binding protein [Rhizomicrobium sp.]
MRQAEVEKLCLSFAATSLVVQWGDHRVFKVGGKIFAILSPVGQRPQTLSFKTGGDSFHILTQLPDIKQAPYLAKSQWVYLERLDALPSRDLKAYLIRAHALIAAGLSKKRRAELGLLTA